MNEQELIYDLIIIGGGPAGITASVYATRKKMNFLVITSDIGGQTALSGNIENYTSYQFITGPELVNKFEEHMQHYGIRVHENEEVVSIRRDDGIFKIKTHKNTYSAKTIIIASGKKSRELNVPGETNFKNRGVTYCATCDGPLFAGKDVAVIGGGNYGLDAVLQMTAIAHHVYLINITQQCSGDAVMLEKILNNQKVTVLNNTHITEVLGNTMVTEIRINTNGKTEIVSVQGIFVEIGLVPNSGFAEIVQRNTNGEIIINSLTETSVPGIFAAGDVTDVPEKQIIVAAGEGAKAAMSVFRYLIKNK